MTDKKEKSKTNLGNNPSAKYTPRELAQKLNVEEYQVAAFYIKNGLSLSKKLGVDEFKKLMK